MELLQRNLVRLKRKKIKHNLNITNKTNNRLTIEPLTAEGLIFYVI